MRRVLLLLSLFCALLLSTLGSSADAAIVRIQVGDTINPISAEYIGRAIKHAEQENAAAVLIELRTPGGLITSTREIIEKVLASKVPVIVYVAPSGGYAASAGFFILESADVAAMAPGTNSGASHPVIFGGGRVDDVMKSKMENDAAAFMRSFVSKRGRNVEAAESAVRESKSFSDQEALDKHLIDVVAKDENDLIQQLDGRTITRFDGSKTTLHLKGQQIEDYGMTVRQEVLGFLMDPNIAFLLLMVGLIAIYAEFNHPGAIVPGVVGTIAILLAIFALNLLPTRFAAVAMILGAFVLFALEVKFTSHGLLGIGGTVLLIMGALLLVDGPIPQMRVNLWTALGVSIPFALITIFLTSIAVKARRNKVFTGDQGIVGEIGTAETALSPRGKVFVHGEIWNAVSSVNVDAGQPIVVRRMEGLQLEVEPAREGSHSVR